MRTLTALLVLLLSLLTFKAAAQPPLSERAEISLLTCGPGDELYSVFGHTAIRVHDPATNLDAVYNYGTFDFDTPNFYLKFVKGDLQYYVSVSSYEDFIYTYQYLDRDVYEQVLNLTPAQEQDIYNELNDVLLSDRKFYTYKFIDRNCTTMAGDVIAQAIPGSISKKNDDNGKTYRKIICEYLDNHFYESLGINLMFGYKTDRELDEPFLPTHLMHGVGNTAINGKPLAQPVKTVYKRSVHAEGSLWNNFYTFAATMLLLLLFSRRKSVYLPFLAVSGMLGIFFCTVHYYSFHDELSLNYNALLFNPLFLILVFFIFAKNSKGILYTAYACLALIAAYVVFMLNKPHLLMVLPIIVVTVYILLSLVGHNRQVSK